jgi:diguanylate cyclase (GGDEF)-like protein
VLAHLAARIMATLRKLDIPCRYGGEEFALLLPATPGPEASLLAERIRKRVDGEIFEVGDAGRLHLTVSLGVAQLGDGEAAKAFVQRADAAMYLAKEAGKNSVHFTE